MSEQPERTDERRIEVYRDASGKYRWRVVSLRGNLPDATLADSGQGYVKKTAAKEMAASLHPTLPVIELEDE